MNLSVLSWKSAYGSILCASFPAVLLAECEHHPQDTILVNKHTVAVGEIISHKHLLIPHTCKSCQIIGRNDNVAIGCEFWNIIRCSLLLIDNIIIWAVPLHIYTMVSMVGMLSL